MDKLIMNVGGSLLHVRSHHLSVIAEVLVKGITILAPLYFHYTNGEAPEEIFESQSSL